MSDETEFSDEELTAFAGKLRDWGASLPQKERALLQMLLREAQDDVGGFADMRFSPSVQNTELPKVDRVVTDILSPIANLQERQGWSMYDEWYPGP
ncbi:MAG: hypothetical protein U5K30_16130 [Acidimicrobiales bacterium]|nr:hypothetical protein [Acidimicrobiales bacterium]